MLHERTIHALAEELERFGCYLRTERNLIKFRRSHSFHDNENLRRKVLSWEKFTEFLAIKSEVFNRIQVECTSSDIRSKPSWSSLKPYVKAKNNHPSKTWLRQNARSFSWWCNKTSILGVLFTFSILSVPHASSAMYAEPKISQTDF